MDSVLTTNYLGYAKDIFGSQEYNEKYGIFYFASEEETTTYFNLKNLMEKHQVICALMDGVNKPLPLYHGELSFEFFDGNVRLSWENVKGHQTATFNEISLLQLMRVEWVRSLVINRKMHH